MGTRLISLAKTRAMYVATQCKAFFIQVKAGKMKPLNEENIKLLVAQWLRESLALSEEARIEHGPYIAELSFS